jgi:mannose-6-phosphate isomerase-like protein (cupin superfamily)
MSGTPWKATVQDMMARLPGPAGERSATAFTHGTMRLLIYAPRGHDPQQPHTQDEVYVVMEGSGVFLCEGHRQTFGPGDVLFAPAKSVHRFENFTDDLVLWVVFYGPQGGE